MEKKKGDLKKYRGKIYEEGNKIQKIKNNRKHEMKFIVFQREERGGKHEKLQKNY